MSCQNKGILLHHTHPQYRPQPAFKNCKKLQVVTVPL